MRQKSYYSNYNAHDALLVRYCNTSRDISHRQTVSAAAQKACNSLRVICNKHLAEYNKIILELLSKLINDIDIPKLILLSSPDTLNSRSQLGGSKQFNDLRASIPEILTEYHKTVDAISKPFHTMCQTLLRCHSISEINANKTNFLSNMHYLNRYFDYPDNAGGKTPTSQIICKQPLLDISYLIAEQATKYVESKCNKSKTEREVPKQSEDSYPGSDKYLIPMRRDGTLNAEAFAKILDSIVPDVDNDRSASSSNNNTLDIEAEKEVPKQSEDVYPGSDEYPIPMRRDGTLNAEAFARILDSIAPDVDNDRSDSSNNNTLDIGAEREVSKQSEDAYPSSDEHLIPMRKDGTVNAEAFVQILNDLAPSEPILFNFNQGDGSDVYEYGDTDVNDSDMDEYSDTDDNGSDRLLVPLDRNRTLNAEAFANILNNKAHFTVDQSDGSDADEYGDTDVNDSDSDSNRSVSSSNNTLDIGAEREVPKQSEDSYPGSDEYLIPMRRDGTVNAEAFVQILNDLAPSEPILFNFNQGDGSDVYEYGDTELELLGNGPPE